MWQVISKETGQFSVAEEGSAEYNNPRYAHHGSPFVKKKQAELAAFNLRKDWLAKRGPVIREDEATYKDARDQFGH